MNDIEALTNKVIIIGKGQILYNGSFDEIKHKYKHFRTIEIEFEEEYENVELENFEFVKSVGKVYTFRTEDKNFNLSKFIAALSKNYKVVDIQVETISIEEIISKMFEELGV